MSGVTLHGYIGNGIGIESCDGRIQGKANVLMTIQYLLKRHYASPEYHVSRTTIFLLNIHYYHP